MTIYLLCENGETGTASLLFSAGLGELHALLVDVFGVNVGDVAPTDQQYTGIHEILVKEELPSE